MSPPLSRVLSIDERKVIFPVLLDVRKGDLDVLTFDMNDWIERLL